jgi:hypothetical protein
MDAALHALTALNNFDGDERWYVDIFVALALGIEGSYRDLNLAFDDRRLNRVASWRSNAQQPTATPSTIIQKDS